MHYEASSVIELPAQLIGLLLRYRLGKCGEAVTYPDHAISDAMVLGIG
jgi:hypothetical protein